MKVVVLTLWLTGLWILLWRDPSGGNVVGGLLAAALVLVMFPARGPEQRDHTLRPVRLVQFVGWFAWQLLVANLVVAREVVTRRDRIRSGIVEVPVHGCSDLVVTIVADAITLTPGTMTLEISRDPPALYVHVLHLYDLDRVRRDIRTLQRLVVGAIGSAEAIRHVAEDARSDVDRTSSPEVS